MNIDHKYVEYKDLLAEISGIEERKKEILNEIINRLKIEKEIFVKFCIECPFDSSYFKFKTPSGSYVFKFNNNPLLYISKLEQIDLYNMDSKNGKVITTLSEYLKMSNLFFTEIIPNIKEQRNLLIEEKIKKLKQKRDKLF